MRDYARLYASLEHDLHLTADSSEPPEGCNTPMDAAKSALLRGLFKKLAPQGQTPQVIEATVAKFVAFNSTVAFVPPTSSDSDHMVYLMHLFRDSIWQLLDLDGDGDGCSFDYVATHWSPGPGSNVKANPTNLYTKLWDSNHSYYDPYTLALFRAAVCNSETMITAYQQWSKSFKPVQIEGNALFTVPKNSEISRTCCTEALLESLFQQGVGSFIEERMAARWNIHLDRQPDFNRSLCRKGSLTGAYGTIDSSMASDSIAVDLCRWCLPPSVLKWVLLLRARRTRLPSGSYIDLNMVSTMGNGFTFPLETAIFASAVRAVYQSKGIPCSFGRDSSNAAVFGDDIVVRKDCYEAVILLLQRLGFTVNVGKSFNSGHFRESCGFDYWLGELVRPVFIETLEAAQDVYSAFNRLSRWSAVHMVPLGRTLFTLLSWAPYLGVPFSEADDSGFKVPSTYAPTKVDERGWFKYTILEAISTATVVPDNLKSAHKAGYKDYNPMGWELIIIGGYAQTRDSTFLAYRKRKLALEQDPNPTVQEATPVPRWVVDIHRRPFQGEVLPRRRRRKAIPYWDFFGAPDGRFNLSSFPAWKGGMEALLASARRV